MPLSSTIAFTVVPNRTAIAERVSPDRTRYVRYVGLALGTTDGAGLAGVAAGDGLAELGDDAPGVTDPPGRSEAGGSDGAREAGAGAPEARPVSGELSVERATASTPKARTTRTTRPAWLRRFGIDGSPKPGARSSTVGVVAANRQRVGRTRPTVSDAAAGAPDTTSPRLPRAARKVAQVR